MAFISLVDGEYSCPLVVRPVVWPVRLAREPRFVISVWLSKQNRSEINPKPHSKLLRVKWRKLKKTIYEFCLRAYSGSTKGWEPRKNGSDIHRLEDRRKWYTLVQWLITETKFLEKVPILSILFWCQICSVPSSLKLSHWKFREKNIVLLMVVSPQTNAIIHIMDLCYQF